MTSQYRRILITGANGFLGSHVGEFLKDNKIKFRAVTRKNFDLLDKEKMTRYVKNTDIIIHLAGNIRTQKTDSAEKHFNINAIGTLNILEAARLNHVKKIILASSVEVYGNTLSAGKITEDSACLPNSYYGQSKLLAEYYCQQYSRKYNIDFTILRFAYLYGKKMHQSRIISKITYAAKFEKPITLQAGKNEYFDLLHVKDAARAVFTSIFSVKSNNKIMNISSGKKTTIRKVADMVKRICPKFRLKYKTSLSVRNSYFYDNNKAQQIMNFKPEINLATGLKDCIENA